jgi:hypothetical protein
MVTAKNKPLPIKRRRYTPLPKKGRQAAKSQSIKSIKSVNGKLLRRIEATELPKAYQNGVRHQDYVDKRMAGMTPRQRERLGRLWQERRKFDKNMRNAGHSFVKILEHVANNEK